MKIASCVTQFIALLTAAVSTVGCVSQTPEPCVQAILNLAFTINPDYEDHVRTEVETIKFYVFDQETGVLKKIFTIGKTEILNRSFQVEDLPDGRYTFIAWGNSSSDMTRNYEDLQLNNLETGAFTDVVVDQTTLSDFYMRLKRKPFDGTLGDAVPVFSDFDDLFHAKAADVQITKGGSSRVTFDFTRNSNILNLNISGLEKVPGLAPLGPKTRSAGENISPLSVFLVGKNGRYKEDNLTDKFAPNMRYDPQKYEVNPDNVSLDVLIKTMRIHGFTHRVDDLLIYFQNEKGENVVEPFDLLYGIQTLEDENGRAIYQEQEDIDREREFDIDIVFDYDDDGDLITHITINDWEVVDPGKPIIPKGKRRRTL